MTETTIFKKRKKTLDKAFFFFYNNIEGLDVGATVGTATREAKPSWRCPAPRLWGSPILEVYND